MHYVKTFLISAVILLFMDGVWLLYLGKGFYVAELGKIMKPAANWYSVIGAYVLMIIGLNYFVILKHFDNSCAALLSGALFGLILYGVYNTTNLAILDGWTVKISLIDTSWGTVACALVSYFSVKLASYFQ